MKKWFLLLLFAAAALGCTESELPPRQYAAWLRNKKNGLCVAAEGRFFQYELQFKPIPFMALGELGTGPPGSARDLARLEKDYEGLEYYTLKIISKGSADVTKHGLKSTAEFYERLNYLSFEMQHDLALVVSTDTLPCVLYHCERNYGTAPYLNISLGFRQADPGFLLGRQLRLLSRIEETPSLFTFDLPQKQLANIPKLKI